MGKSKGGDNWGGIGAGASKLSRGSLFAAWELRNLL